MHKFISEGINTIMNNNQVGYFLIFISWALFCLLSNLFYDMCLFGNCTSLESLHMQVESLNITEHHGSTTKFDIGLKIIGNNASDTYVCKYVCYRARCTKVINYKYEQGKTVKVYEENDGTIVLNDKHHPKNRQWYVILLLSIWPGIIFYSIWNCCSCIPNEKEKRYGTSPVYDDIELF